MIFDTIVSRQPIDKGWSGDKKYRAETLSGDVFLLRISPADKLERCKAVHEHMKTLSKLDIPMCRPFEFGICDEGVYSVQQWIDGYDAEQVKFLQGYIPYQHQKI